MLFAYQGQGYLRHLLNLNTEHWLLRGGEIQEHCGYWRVYDIAMIADGWLVSKRLQANYARWLGHSLGWHVVPVWHEPKLIFMLDYIEFIKLSVILALHCRLFSKQFHDASSKLKSA
jgi:hypothetical protein